MGTQKNRLIEMVLLSTQSKCLNKWIRNYSQFYAKLGFLPGPMVTCLLLLSVMSMGLSEGEARLGLRACDGNVQSSVTHIFKRREVTICIR